tara:strand:- start:10058 stop:10327 length:270 start_codon:yes stop_codon:yes gene_type:complete
MNISDLLKDALDETGASLEVSAGRAQVLIAEEGVRLTLASQEPGFNMVLRASRDNIALQLGVDASEEAGAADQRLVGIIQSILFGLATA